MSASAFLCEGITPWPYCAMYWGPNRRTTSANSTSALGGQTLFSAMAGPPSLEEAVGGLAQQCAELVPQRLCEVGIDLGGSQARMPEQDLDDANVHAALEHVRGEAVAQRVRSEVGAKTAGIACLDERGACGRIRQMGHRSPAGKEPLPAAVGFPDLAEHLENGFGQWEDALFVSLADDAQHSPPGVDCGDGRRDRLVHAQAICVDERETAPKDGLLQGGDQAAAILVTSDIGQPLAAWPANLFFVNKGQS